MSSVSGGRPVLLHIANFAGVVSPETTAIEQLCEESGLSVERCPHVYLGLARVLAQKRLTNNGGGFANAPSEVLAVVLCVEDLSASELEFFSLMERNRRDVPVHVYGSRSADRIVQALQAGARGLATRDAIFALRSRQSNRMIADDRTGSGSADASIKTEPIQQPEQAAAARIQSETPNAPLKTVDVPLPTAIAEARSPVMEPVEAPTKPMSPVSLEDADDSAEEGATQAARVPWLRYNGGPERAAPVVRKKPEDVVSAPQPAPEPASEPDEEERVELFSSPCSLEDEYEPLLTEQELAALLGDEMGDVSAAERNMLAGEGEKPGSSSR